MYKDISQQFFYFYSACCSLLCPLLGLQVTKKDLQGLPQKNDVK